MEIVFANKTEAPRCMTGAQLQQCRPYEVCVALSSEEIQENTDTLPLGVMVGDVGICSTPLSSGLLLPNASYVPPARCGGDCSAYR